MPFDWLRSIRNGLVPRRTRRRCGSTNAVAFVEVLECRTLLSAPNGEDDSFTLEAGSSAQTLDVVSNDVDPEDGALVLDSVGSASHGTAAIETIGGYYYGPTEDVLRYTPASSYVGSDSFTYTVEDPEGLTDAATVSIEVHTSDDVLSEARATSPVDDVEFELRGRIGDGSSGSADVDLFEIALAAGETLHVDVDARNLDDGTQLSQLDAYLRLFDGYGSEILSVDDGTDPDSGASGYDSVLEFTAQTSGTYYVGLSGNGNEYYYADSAGSGSAGSVGDYLLQITVSPNATPVAVDDAVRVERNSLDAVLPVLANDSDPEGAELGLDSVGTAAHGTATIESGGGGYYYYYSGSDDDVVKYTPDAGYVGDDAFTYTVSDDFGQTDTATVDVDVVASDDTLATAFTLATTAGVRLETTAIVGDGVHDDLDVDLYRVDLVAGQILTIDVDAAALDAGGSLSDLDAHLVLFDDTGIEIASSSSGVDPDTGQWSGDPILSYVVTATGAYHLGVSGSGN